MQVVPWKISHISSKQQRYPEQRKRLQMHSALLEMNVRVYTPTQMLPSYLLLLKNRIFKLQLSGQDESHPCSEAVSIGLKGVAPVEDTPAHAEMCPKVDAKV